MATSTIKNPNGLSKQNTGSNTPFKWYKFGRVVFCALTANSISTTAVSGYNKICDIPEGFEPISSAETIDDIHNDKRIVFSQPTGMGFIVHTSEAYTGQNIRGNICYISAN